ncbi:MAG: hypothetical protein WBW48_20940 [Anaerolineae bacterium]
MKLHWLEKWLMNTAFPPNVVIYEHEFKRVFEDTGFVFDTYRPWAGLPVSCFAIARKGLRR